MGYLRLRRSHVIIVAFLVFALVMSAFPNLDLAISRLFYDGHSFLRGQWWQAALQASLPWFLGLSIGGTALVYGYNVLRKRNVGNVNWRRVVYLPLVALIGAGLIVNVALKDNVGRARPRDVTEFGGTKHFTQAFVLSDQCSRNCSFSSGDAAAAFYSVALVMALTRRRWLFAAGVGFGVLVSFARVSAGAHFFSDTVVSFFVMLIVADVLYYYLVMSPADRHEAAKIGIRVRPAYVSVAPEPIAKISP